MLIRLHHFLFSNNILTLKRLAGMLIGVPALLVCLYGCGTPESEQVTPSLEAIFALEQPNSYDVPSDTPPDDGCIRLRTYAPHIPLYKAFADLNDEHLRYARRDGIKPITDDASAWRNSERLVKVKSDSTFMIDELKHSYPYLRPHAAKLLHDIGYHFHRKLNERGGGDYRIKVTSLLRTDATVGKLRRVNRNASSESAHSYATTFDISYSKFICDNANGTRRTFEDLKNLLAEVVDSLRSDGRCLVKREHRQACFHITAIDSI